MHSQKKHQWWAGILSVLLAVIICVPSALAQDTTSKANFRLPIDGIVATPGDEAVHLAGNLHVQFQITGDAVDGFLISAHANAQDISGESVEGKAKYQGVGVGDFNANANVPESGASEFIGTFNVGLIGQGQAPNYRLHISLHGSINANSDLTAAVEEVVIRDN